MDVKQSKNTVSFSAFCAELHAPLKNVRNSWCAINHEWRRAIFTVWADELLNGRYVFWEHADASYKHLPGGKEMRRVIEDVMQRGYEAIGVVCEATDVNASPRQRQRFIEDRLLSLRLVEEKEGFVGYVVGEVAATQAKAEAFVRVHPVLNAIDDLNEPPPGAVLPEKRSRPAEGYLRDNAVRTYVLARAGGKCEYCGKSEFFLPDGTPYLETHHIIGLAQQGPDTPKNVIALCAGHHREAHYGANAETLEHDFLRTLSGIRGRSDAVA